MPHVRMPEFAVDVPAYTAGSDAALVEAGRHLTQFWEWSMALPDSLDDAHGRRHGKGRGRRSQRHQ